MEPFDHDENGTEPKNPTDGGSVLNDNGNAPEQDDRLEDTFDSDAYDTYDDEYDDKQGKEVDECDVDPTSHPPADPRADKSYDFLNSILEEMGMDVSVQRRQPRPESSPDEINLEIVGRDVGRVIGKKGQVLSALQYLVNRVTNRPGLPRRHVVIDAEGYRYRRETSLATMARRLGEQAVKEGKIITFEPMSPRDRRVVHLALAKFEHVVTKSDGEGDARRVRIIPVRR